LWGEVEGGGGGGEYLLLSATECVCVCVHNVLRSPWSPHLVSDERAVTPLFPDDRPRVSEWDADSVYYDDQDTVASSSYPTSKPGSSAGSISHYSYPASKPGSAGSISGFESTGMFMLSGVCVCVCVRGGGGSEREREKVRERAQ
jgi:hypothetical protein